MHMGNQIYFLCQRNTGDQRTHRAVDGPLFLKEGRYCKGHIMDEGALSVPRHDQLRDH
jgi:hypothetical protein